MTTKNLLRAGLLVFTFVAGMALYVGLFPKASSAQVQSTPASPAQVAASPAAAQALQRLQLSSGTQIVSHVSRATGVYDFVRAGGTATLPAAVNVLATPESRARTFLSQNGDLVGMSATERTLVASTIAPAETVAASALKVAKVTTDTIGGTHVKFDQTYKGLKVFGAQLVVHMNANGITAVNGNFVPGVNVSKTPKVNSPRAGQIATRFPAGLSVTNTELSIYRIGLLEGRRGDSVLAYAVEVSDGHATREQIWVEATKGTRLNRIALNHDAMNRTIYTPTYGAPFDVRHEGDPLTPGPTPGTIGAEPINNLYVFAGHTYNLYRSGFGRDSYDGLGHIMHSVLLVNQNCPNAYWNSTSTNYCPDFDADDVVSHEWGHAYTEYTHNLIYAYQSGALNESYSDIFGETADLLNGVDAEGGSNNTQPMPDGQRWQMGEDVNGLNQPAAGILRDMWDPTRYGDPDKVSSGNYSCGSGDGGGVHTNSGVPNHAYAMLVDGKTYNGQTVAPIGFVRALAIYFRAMTVYQTRTTDFPAHATALRASCNDLIGQPLNALSTSSGANTSSPDLISASTCQQVDKAILAVEMETPPLCPVSFVLDNEAPESCPGATNIFSENWEDGNMNGWTLNSAGTFPEWNDTSRPVRDFKITATSPAGHAGKAAMAKAPIVGEPGGGGCTPGVDDYSGQFSMDSPTITIPAGADAVSLSFEHYLATEAGVDGGQVELSVNGGVFQLIPAANYVHNKTNSSYNLPPPADNNTNPNPGEDAWTGANVGTSPTAPPGSWGTTVVDLSSLTNPGDTVKVRFTWSQDGCNGVDGWYVDNIRVYTCPVLPAPTLSLGEDYEVPDANGTYTLQWNRPAFSTGPDQLQESPVACGPLMTDDAQSGTAKWTADNDGSLSPTWQTSSAKPGHAPNTAFWAMPTSEQGADSARLTLNEEVQIPLTGTTTLNFSEWYFNEDDDRGIVEVSPDNGATWTPVYSNARPMGDLPDSGASAFANEGLAARHVDLSAFGGRGIRLRFRYFQGASDFIFFVQYGWYIDNISITNDSWADAARANITSFLIQDRTSGTRCYRVRTSYTFGNQLVPGLYSNEVRATSSLSDKLPPE